MEVAREINKDKRPIIMVITGDGRAEFRRLKVFAPQCKNTWSSMSLKDLFSSLFFTTVSSIFKLFGRLHQKLKIEKLLYSMTNV